MAPDDMLFLVDPYPARLRAEHWLGFSGTRAIARRGVERFGGRARFVELDSLEAARTLEPEPRPVLVFVDARHDYEAVRSDLLAWAPRLADGGVIAVHDAMPCAPRPDLRDEAGACRAVGEVRASGWALIAYAESLALLAPR